MNTRAEYATIGTTNYMRVTFPNSTHFAFEYDPERGLIRMKKRGTTVTFDLVQLRDEWQQETHQVD